MDYLCVFHVKKEDYKSFFFAKKKDEIDLLNFINF